jgi:Prolyl oligopeptidase family
VNSWILVATRALSSICIDTHIPPSGRYSSHSSGNQNTGTHFAHCRPRYYHRALNQNWGKRRALLACAVTLAVSAVSGAKEVTSFQKRPMTAADVIQSTIVIGPVTPSLDGHRFVVALMRGDLERNGNWLEIASGTTSSLDAASKTKIVAQLFTSSKRDPGDDGRSSPFFNFARSDALVWLNDNERVAFLWNDGETPTQVTTVNVRTGAVESLTHHPKSISAFSLSPSSSTLIYLAFPGYAHPTDQENGATGYAVREPDYGQTASAHVGEGNPWWIGMQYFVASPEIPNPVRLDGGVSATAFPRIVFNGNERYALNLNRPTEERPSSWQKYSNAELQSNLADAGRFPFGPALVPHIEIIDIKTATTRRLWDAPSNAKTRAIWSPDGRTVVVGPTFLPTTTDDPAGLEGIAIAEVDIGSGQFWEIAPPVKSTADYYPVRWKNDRTLEIANGEAVLEYRKTNGSWVLIRSRKFVAVRRPSIQIEWRQDANSPPLLYASTSSSPPRERRIFDPDPKLHSEFVLGRVQYVEWTDRSGAKWGGRLYYPVHYSPTRSFPLVIQTNSHIGRSEFSLLGNVWIGTAGYAAQPLAARDIAVLQIDDTDALRTVTTSPKEPEMALAGYDSAVDCLVKMGIVNRSRVGLQGMSRTVWHVDYALTRADTRYAAAFATNGSAMGYLEYTLFPLFHGEYDFDNGATPFGRAGLTTWLQMTPAFNVDRIHTPLFVASEGSLASGNMLLNWEMFSRLRQLNKPVEFFIYPDQEHSDHQLQIPRQKLASIAGAVDWFDFWLNDHEDADPEKVAQYQRWHKLRDLHRQDLAGIHDSH